jgi:aspartate/tyrosine/aromatic aminotransferase
MVFFEKMPLLPPDPIFGLTSAFQADLREQKVNLGAGIYKNEALITPILSSVKQAEESLLRIEKSKEYLPIHGDQAFINCVGQLVFGAEFWASESKRIAGFQTPGGTGALCIGGGLLNAETSTLFLSNPTWPNHHNIFKTLRFQVGIYPYYDVERHQIDFEKMLSFVNTIPPQSVLVLHAACHNPTGADLTTEQWEELAEVCMKRKILPFFDCAYQGFGRGLNEDVASIQIFAKKPIEMVVAVSQSKNFSLYGERVGAVYVVTSNSAISQAVTSRIKQFIRACYSNPPLHGAKIVAHILQEPSLRALWLQELETMRNRINGIRNQFVEKLSSKIPHRNLSDIKSGAGMFCLVGLSQTQVEQIIQEFGIYMTTDSRINLCGLTQSNIDYVAQGIAAVCHNKKVD